MSRTIKIEMKKTSEKATYYSHEDKQEDKHARNISWRTYIMDNILFAYRHIYTLIVKSQLEE